ncbi:hypothetical protein OIDMADRAFT_44425 [Oidiodendron maius Zn]|uniref:AttH domain-containing protein n=1 Tax=Oidiodendron maius (strain Zn) TaxID=913774 RepID=A0A0C3H0N5_OIDMZ|nr:hypothetical protein OIDMADRAFT_44425 [Oidiodendron maius Zn]
MLYKLPTLLYSLLVGYSFCNVLSSNPHSVSIIPSAISNDTSIVQYVSDIYGPDAPKVKPIDEPAFSWWYFDVVSDNLESSIDVFFYTTPAVAGDGVHALSVSLSAHFANGTAFNVEALADGATVVTDGGGSSGHFDGTGFRWTSTPDMSLYLVEIDSPALGVNGTISLESVAPGHYPCGPISPGQDMQVGPGLGWSNALPDSKAQVDLTLNGTALSFAGVGYHDQRWAAENYALNFGSWYWGHGHLGPYSIVWYDLLSLNNNLESVSGYAARDNQIITATCNGIKVRPIGENSTYPPGKGTGRPGAFHITLDLAGGEILEVDATPERVIFANSDLYTRWIGRLNGTLAGIDLHYASNIKHKFSNIKCKF